MNEKKPYGMYPIDFRNERRQALSVILFSGSAIITAGCGLFNLLFPPKDNYSRIKATSQALAGDPEMLDITLENLPKSLRDNAVKITFKGKREIDGAEGDFFASGMVLRENNENIIIVSGKHVLFPEGIEIDNLSLSQPQNKDSRELKFSREDIIGHFRGTGENEASILVINKKSPGRFTAYSPIIMNPRPLNAGEVLFSISYPDGSGAVGWFANKYTVTGKTGTIDGISNLSICTGINNSGGSGSPVVNIEGELVGFTMAGHTVIKEVGIIKATSLNDLVTKIKEQD